jgi:hypothetical protein
MVRVQSVTRAFGLFVTIWITFGLFVASPGRAQAPGAAVLTNDDVVKMVQAKLGDAVIVNKIKSSPSKFETNTDALIGLKGAGVSDAVLAAMAGAGAPAAVATGPVAPPPDPNDPLSPHPPGIYYVRKNPGGRSMVLLEPTVYSGGKSGGVLKHAMTSGFSKMKWKAVVQGSRANLRLTESRPTFYFYFEERAGTLGSASSPNEYVLARMESKKDERELIVGQMSAFGASTGTRSKDTISFDFQKVKPGIYKVDSRTDIEPGEYCFFYAGGTQALGATGGKLFDFGINPAE